MTTKTTADSNDRTNSLYAQVGMQTYIIFLSNDGHEISRKKIKCIPVVRDYLMASGGPKKKK